MDGFEVIMPIIIRIVGTPHDIIVENHEDLSLKQVKQKVAEVLNAEALESIKIDFYSTKMNVTIDSNSEERTLRGDYGLSNNTIKVRAVVASAPTLKEATKIQKAKEGLIQAITEAQSAGAHVIITVGSCLQPHPGEQTALLLRQQFPVEHLGDINKEAPIHFIHIDPAFEAPPSEVKQLHDMKDWRELKKDGLMKSYNHSSKPYRITTLAIPITNAEEARAYFHAKGKPSTLLDVSLHEYALTARRKGTGFITGNFYDPEALPVIKIAPAAFLASGREVAAPSLPEKISKL
jgi:hypothetical protein